MAGYSMLRRLTMDRSGYGAFKCQIALLFDRETVLKLATFFEFPPADYDAICRSYTPGLDFVTMIDAKDIIKESDDTAIVDALKRIDRCGIARRVGNLFSETIRKIKDTAFLDNSDRQDMEFDRDDFPYLEDDQFYDFENTRDEMVILNRKAGRDLEAKFKRYGLQRNKDASASQSSGELRIAVIGKTGQGKSATANSILGLGAFDADDSSLSVTTDPSRRSCVFDGRKIFVVDTPGLQDTDRGEERILREICRIPMLLEKGVHAFVYVFNGADPRFGKGDLDVLQSLQEAFGEDFTEYCVVLFTRAESTLKTKSLEDYLEKQKQSPELKIFLDQVDWRVLALENNATSLAEKHRNQSCLVSLVDKIVSQNVKDGRSEAYTTEMFQIAQKEKQRAKARSQARGWGEEVYEATEGAQAVLGKVDYTDQEYFQQMSQRLPLVYNEVLQEDKRGTGEGLSKVSGKNEKLEEKLKSIGNGRSLHDELQSEIKQQQEDFESLWVRLCRWLKRSWDKIKDSCVIS